VCHGATGKGNDQVRFEVSYYALKPDVRVIAPWREWSFQGRPDLIAYAKQHGIPIAAGKEQEAPFSIDANLLHTSSEGLALEDPDVAAPDIVTKRGDRRTITPEEAPDQAMIITIGFKEGDAISLNGKVLKAHELLKALNDIGKKHGIGGLDLVENRFVGMKSRGFYETPGGTILWQAHRAIESICLDRGAMHLKDELMPKYATLIYNGMWFTPERKMLQAAIDASQDDVTGEVRLKLYKGGVYVQGRSSPYSLYNKDLVGFDAAGGYNQKDAEGFIKLNALRLRIAAWRDKRVGKNE
jgi:argininosuccinate synthase